MRRWLLSCLLWWPLTAQAATVLEHSFDLRVEGELARHTERLVVLLEEPADLTRWQRHRIGLDRYVTLVDCVAEVLQADGTVVEKVPRRAFEREDSTGFGLYTSAWTQIVPFRKLEVGRRLRLEIELLVAPPYPSAAVPLQLDAVQHHLRVFVSGAERLHWRVDGSLDGLAVREVEGGLALEAKAVPAFRRSDVASGATLRLGWGREHSWAAVGLWYAGLLERSPRGSQAVLALAEELCAAAATRRECCQRLADHVRRRVRYEAVAIGDGGWVPTAAAEVLARGWGDCKDKSELLVELLSARGVEAHLVLLRAGATPPLDVDFPSPNQLNHSIVAISTEQLDVRPGDPVVDGYYLIDPTADRGGIDWLNPMVQGRPALLVDGQRSRLLAIPEWYEAEQTVLEVTGLVAEAGDLRGEVVLRLTGAAAVRWLYALDTMEPGAFADQVRMRLLQPLVPGGTVGEARWQREENGAPMIQLAAALELPGAVRGDQAARWLRPIVVDVLPSPEAVAGGVQSVRLAAGVVRSRLELELPERWSLAAAEPVEAETELGRFTLEVSLLERRLRVESELELRRSLIEPEQLPSLRALALAESRAEAYRVRLLSSSGI